MSSVEKISLLNTLFYVTLVAAILFLVITAVLFFVFKIPQIYMLKTGKARKRSIDQMKKFNSETGRLMAEDGKEHGISQIFGNSSDLNSKTAMLNDPNAGTHIEANERVKLENDETTVLSHQTSIQPAAPAPKYGETTVLSQLVTNIEQPKPTVEMPVPNNSFGRFEVVRYIIKVHTDEFIM